MPCVDEETQYHAVSDFSGLQETVVISRDNCIRPGLYCDPQILTCQSAKILGVSCVQDKECFSVRLAIDG
jgi:hypothetical protein